MGVAVGVGVGVGVAVGVAVGVGVGVEVGVPVGPGVAEGVGRMVGWGPVAVNVGLAEPNAGPDGPARVGDPCVGRAGRTDADGELELATGVGFAGINGAPGSDDGGVKALNQSASTIAIKGTRESTPATLILPLMARMRTVDRPPQARRFEVARCTKRTWTVPQALQPL